MLYYSTIDRKKGKKIAIADFAGEIAFRINDWKKKIKENPIDIIYILKTDVELLLLSWYSGGRYIIVRLDLFVRLSLSSYVIWKAGKKNNKLIVFQQSMKMMGWELKKSLGGRDPTKKKQKNKKRRLSIKIIIVDFGICVV